MAIASYEHICGHTVALKMNKEDENMAKMTSAQAAKELRKLLERHSALLEKEEKACMFRAVLQENIEDVRPAYDYDAMQTELAQIETQIRRLKHAINQFNISQVVPGFDMTIDQMLVYLPQLSARKRKFEQMQSHLPKERITSYASNFVEYTYCNYDIAQAEADYAKVADELARAQTALDTVNTTVEFDV